MIDDDLGTRYWLQGAMDSTWQQVPIEVYLEAERANGFHGPAGQPATAAFTGPLGSGRTFEQDEQ